MCRRELGEGTEDGDRWSSLQVARLRKAQLSLPASAPNFWNQVAQHVPDKTAAQCRARWFAQFGDSDSGDSDASQRMATGAFAVRGRGAVVGEVDPLKVKLGKRGTAKRQRQLRALIEQVRPGSVCSMYLEQCGWIPFVMLHIDPCCFGLAEKHWSRG